MCKIHSHTFVSYYNYYSKNVMFVLCNFYFTMNVLCKGNVQHFIYGELAADCAQLV